MWGFLTVVIPGSLVGRLMVRDNDQEETLNSILSYTITSLSPASASGAFAIDGTSGTIHALRLLRRREQAVYNLNVRVSDPGSILYESTPVGWI